MNEEQFNEFLEGELSRIREVMTIKSTYRKPENIFHNFDAGMQIEGDKSREEIIWGMAIKHFISIQDIRRGLKEGKLPTKETLDEKYTDLINYLFLEKASIECGIEKAERREELENITGCDDDPCEVDKSSTFQIKGEGAINAGCGTWYRIRKGSTPPKIYSRILLNESIWAVVLDVRDLKMKACPMYCYDTLPPMTFKDEARVYSPICEESQTFTPRNDNPLETLREEYVGWYNEHHLKKYPLTPDESFSVGTTVLTHEHIEPYEKEFISKEPYLKEGQISAPRKDNALDKVKIINQTEKK